MSVITFSTKFPAYHPKAGQPTYFVEKILSGLLKMESKGLADAIYESRKWLSCNDVDSFLEVVESQTPKFHTIRAGHRFKVGDMFSPRIWSGRPYNSKQIILAPDLKVEKVWNFEIYKEGIILTNKEGELYGSPSLWGDLAKNDGLELKDFLDWFQYPKPFKGQIICWSKNVNY